MAKFEERGVGETILGFLNLSQQKVGGLVAYADASSNPLVESPQVPAKKKGLEQGSKNKTSVIGMASLNLAEFACTAQEEVEINLPLLLPGVNSESHLSLILALSLLELRTSQESFEIVQRPIVPAPLSPSSGDALPSEKNELSALKAGLRKVKILTDFVSTRKAKKTCREDESSEGRCSARSEDADYPYPFDTDFLDDDLEGELEEDKENSSIRKSFSYGTLATANYVGGSFYSDMRINGEYEDWVYYSHRKSDVACSHAEDMTSSVQEQTVLSSKRSILPWRKRKLSFRSPKAKEEPLLKKCNGEEGGDDIDYDNCDKRQLSSSDESLSGLKGKVDEDASCPSPSLPSKTYSSAAEQAHMLAHTLAQNEQIPDRRSVVKENRLTSQILVKWKQRISLASTERPSCELVKHFPTFDLETRSNLRGGYLSGAGPEVGTGTDNLDTSNGQELEL
ncbi:uncharacterized protein LOC109847101 [Asparagus officinalis]|uniref:uncharacterized protein LOC109847101 n=1 Tax=Asparagus officinalis TaxID=4686 RepID=UPI00098E4D3E|nr:uncharacterized protein LOC109847101 [Asparagus officinalis]